MIRGITFDNQMFYSADFAHFLNFFLDGTVGTTKGCSITHDGTKVTIGKGYFIAQGSLMNVETEEVVEGFASGYNRIVYEIDLSQENTLTEFKQGAIKVLQTEELIQEDLEAGGMIYQFPICHFQWTGTAISSFVVDAQRLDEPSAGMPTIELDGETFTGNLKMTTKYQWVDDNGYFPCTSPERKFWVGYKGEKHCFMYNSTTKNHYKVVNGELIADLDCPAAIGVFTDMRPVCSDENYIYAMTKATNKLVTIQRFDGEKWEALLTIPNQTGSSEDFQGASSPNVYGNKLYWNARTQSGTSSNRKYHNYAGYVDLTSLTWVDLPSLPSDVAYMSCAIAEINGELYLIGGITSHVAYNVYKLNASDNSWTKIGGDASHGNSITVRTYFDLIVLENKVYCTTPMFFQCFDGTETRVLSHIENGQYISLFFTDRLHFFACTCASMIDDSNKSTRYNIMKTYEKVLCLEG